MAYLEKFWKCSACGTDHISALRKLKCPNCGHTKADQDKEEHTEQEITDAEGLELAKGGPHWVCGHCWSKNLDKHTDCQSCGNPRDATDTSFVVKELGTVLPVRTEAVRKSARSSNSSRVTAAQSVQSEQPASFMSRISILQICGGVTVLALLVLLLFAFFRTETYKTRVSGFSWSREVAIEKFTAQQESGWSLPLDAYNVYRTEKIRDYEPIYQDKQVSTNHPQTCYRDLGNGADQSYDCSYTTSETKREKIGEKPIWDTWYEYRIDRWIYTRTVSASGEDREPHWPGYTLIHADEEVIGAERVDTQREFYTVHFIEDDVKDPKTYTLTVSQDIWLQYEMEKGYPLEVNSLGMIMNDPLKPK